MVPKKLPKRASLSENDAYFVTHHLGSYDYISRYVGLLNKEYAKNQYEL